MKTILTLALALLPGLAAAQSFPTKPIRVVLPFGAGGVADITARTVGQAIAYDFGFVRPIVSFSIGNNNVVGNPDTRTYLFGATAPLGAGRQGNRRDARRR